MADLLLLQRFNSKPRAVYFISVKETMCLIFKISKYTAVPILTEWLNGRELLKLDSALVNQQFRSKYLELLKEYFHLFHVFNSHHKSEICFVELCGWYRKFEFAIDSLNCKIHAGNYDLTKVVEFGLITTAARVCKSVFILDCDVTTSDRTEIPEILSGFKYVQELKLGEAAKFPTEFVPYSLHSLKVKVKTEEMANFVASLCRNCTLLSSIEMSGSSYNSVMMAMTIYCKNLKTLKGHFDIGGSTEYYAQYIFALHSVCQLQDWDFDTTLYEPLHLNTFLWYKGNSLTKIPLGDFWGNDSDMDIDILSVCPEAQSICLRSENEQHLFNSSFTDKLYSIFIHDAFANNLLNSLSTYSNLHKIELEFVEMDDSNLLQLMSSCTLLSSFTMILCYGCSEAYFDIIVSYGSNLVYMFLSGGPAIVSQQPTNIARNLTKLQDALLYGSDSVDYNVIVGLLNCPSINFVEIESTNIVHNSDSIDLFYSKASRLNLVECELKYIMLITLLSHCPNVTDLSIRDNKTLTSDNFISIGPFSKRLRTLNICKCALKNDSVVEVLSYYFKRLQYLYSDLSETALEKLRSGCIGLKTC